MDKDMLAAGLYALGFGPDAIDVIRAAGKDVLRNPEPAPFGEEAMYADSQGILVAFGTGPTGEDYVAPMVRGRAGNPAVCYRFTDCLADVVFIDERDGDVAARVVAGLEAPSAIVEGAYNTPTSFGEARMHLGALAIDGVRLHRSAADYDEEREAKGETDAPGPRHLLSPWDGRIEEGQVEAARAQPTASMAAEILQASKRTNPLTGRDFWHVEALSAVPVTIALPGELFPGTILGPGMIVSGTFLLGISA